METEEDLHEAVAVADGAFKATPGGHPDLAVYLNNLGDRSACKLSRPVRRIIKILSFQQIFPSWQYAKSPPSLRIRLAKIVANINASSTGGMRPTGWHLQ
jgi:hypothetical protein